MKTKTKSVTLPLLECLIEGEEQQFGETHAIQARVGNVLVPIAEVYISVNAGNMVPDDSQPCGSRTEESVEVDEKTMVRYARELVARFNAHKELLESVKELLGWHAGQAHLHGLTPLGRRNYNAASVRARAAIAKSGGAK